MNCSFCNSNCHEYNNIYDFFNFNHKHFLKYELGIKNDIICIPCCKKKVINCKYCNFLSLDLCNTINCDICCDLKCINCLSINYSDCCSTKFMNCKLCYISKGYQIKKYCRCNDNICIFCCNHVEYFKCSDCNDDVCDKCEFNNTCNYCSDSYCNYCFDKHEKKIKNNICFSCNNRFYYCNENLNKCSHGFPLCNNCIFESKNCYFCKDNCKCCIDKNLICNDDNCSVIHSKYICLECFKNTDIKNIKNVEFNKKKRFLNVQKCKYHNKLFCDSHLFQCKLCNNKLHQKFKKNNFDICKLCFNKSYPCINFWKEYLYRPNSKYVTEKLTKRFNDNLEYL